MAFWIVIAVLYVVEWGIFRRLGGVSAAGDAVRRWGHSVARARPTRTSS
jgi:hypothetical protein